MSRSIGGTALRFGIVGFANTLVTVAVTLLLTRVGGLHVGLASGIGYGVGLVQGFTLNRAWTFKDETHAATPAMQALGYVIVNVVCGSLYAALNVALVQHLPDFVSFLASLVVTVPISFALNRLFVFRRQV